MSEAGSIIDEIAGEDPGDDPAVLEDGAGTGGAEPDADAAAAAAAAAEAAGKGDGGTEPTAEEAAAAAEAKKAEDDAAEKEAAEKAAADAATVPHAALHEERVRRQDLQKTLDETTGRMEQMENLFKQITDPEGGKEELPDFETDPAGHIMGQMAKLQEQLTALGQTEEGRQKASSEQNEQREFLDSYAVSAAEFSKATPDFDAAYAWLATSVDAELQARGFIDPKERAEAMQFEEGRVVGFAMKQGKNPAEAIYTLAKHRGYTGPAPGAAGGNGAAGATAEQDALDRLKAGQAASESLSGGSAGPEGVMTLEELSKLADTDPERFDAEWEKARRLGRLG